MQRHSIQRSNGAKAVAIDNSITIAHYRLLQLLTLILSAAFALGLHIFWGR